MIEQSTAPNLTGPALLLTKTEAAKALRLCVRSIEMAVEKKALSVVRIGPRCVRFRPSDLERFIESRRIRAIGETANP